VRARAADATVTILYAARDTNHNNAAGSLSCLAMTDDAGPPAG
jgi:uncharacterized protein YeaO (DUF488 family)